MIACKFLEGSYPALPVVDGETVLNYCVRLMKLTGREPLPQETCAYVVLSEGKCINQADKRHELLSSVADLTKPLCAVSTTMASSSRMALVKGNMRSDGFEPELTTCSICFEEFQHNTEDHKRGVAEIFLALPCLHRFHLKCVASQGNLKCALCRTPIDE